MAPDDGIDETSRAVGARLRAVRRQRGLSLDDVEETSGGRWSASAVGAYERGVRNLSLPRLRELADHYCVPIDVLLDDPAPPAPGRPLQASPVTLDLVALEGEQGGALEPVAAFARRLVERRGDWNGRVLTVRADDVRAFAWGMGLDEHDFVELLHESHVAVVDIRAAEDGVPPGRGSVGLP
jgi:transcriptional regulator with XRE-family HTH domain